KSDGKTDGQGYLWNFSFVIWNKLWPDLDGEKDLNDDHREEITFFVQSIPGFQECDEEYVETWMAYDAEDRGFQMLNGEEVVTFVQEESEPVDDATDEDEDNNNGSRDIVEARVHQMLTRFLRWRQLWSGTNNNQSVVLFNYCCSRESETLQRKNEGVQWYSEK
ncbi:hypothetical protein TNCV_2585081, partial [Trichonephila clavipes]